MLTVEQMENHISSLVREHGIARSDIAEMEGCGEGDEQSALEFWEIWIAPTITSYKSYCAALHEIGHLLGQPGCTSMDRITRESAAWQWARENALEWNDEAEADVKDCLNYYATEIEAGRIPAECESTQGRISNDL